MQKTIIFFSIFILAFSAITLVALQIKPLGWLSLGIGALITLLAKDKQFRQNIILIYLSLALLGIATISTSIEPSHMWKMGPPLILAVILPYFISKYIYKNNVIHFAFAYEKKWQLKEIGYILLTGLLVYLFLPIMLRLTNSYQNWTIEANPNYLIASFIGINVVGIYDELFFMGTVLRILKNHLPYWAANLTQSIIFTSFLYELGFRGWFFVCVFIFAFLQGRVFYKTNSLLYLISIHLTADFILYLALIHAYYPNLMPIFLIK
ncbi:CPBP family intramembrane metalloprotease [Candidatus Roizmanbacteria bacterium]|nr:CPBP family intramembrane metalloprotease [Candidatus Roizmanbacteria bacterium]